MEKQYVLRKSEKGRQEGRLLSSIKAISIPQLIVEGADGKILDVHYLPAGARIEVSEGRTVQAGQLLAHQPRAMAGTQDITGGLPRVTEVFEARRPKDPAVMAEISGKVELRSDKRSGQNDHNYPLRIRYGKRAPRPARQAP